MLILTLSVSWTYILKIKNYNINNIIKKINKKYIIIIFLLDDATVDDLIDVIEGNRIYIPCIYVLNKIDQISIEEVILI